MTIATEPPERVGELVRLEDWREAEQWSVEEALDYASEMLYLNYHWYGDRPQEFWWMYFDHALLVGYPEWKWERKPQFGLEEFGSPTGGSA